jgi:hypothetical protein
MHRHDVVVDVDDEGRRRRGPALFLLLPPPAWVLHCDTVCFAVSVPAGRIPSQCLFMSCSGSAAVAGEFTESPAAAAPEISIVPSGGVLDWEPDAAVAAAAR